MNTLTSLPAAFYARPAEEVAHELLGKLLVHRINGHDLIGRITEVEAYLGPHDLAAHSRFGETPRNIVLFGPHGYWYVYLIYGIYNLLNVTTGPAGSAVLLRAVEPIAGIDADAKLNGPGKLTRAMSIGREYYGVSAIDSPLFISDDGYKIDTEIAVGPRVGVSYAREWADAPLRYQIEL